MSPPHAPSTIAASADQETSDQTEWFRDEIAPHEKSLRAYLRARFPTLSDFDDLVQETYLRVIRTRQENGNAMNKSYLFTVARNVGLDLFRRKRAVTIEGLAEFERLSVLDNAPNAADVATHAEQRQILIEAIQALPERCRQVITLRKIYGLSHHEIAEQLKMAENTVNAQVTLGMARMRDYLRARGVNGGYQQ